MKEDKDDKSDDDDKGRGGDNGISDHSASIEAYLKNWEDKYAAKRKERDERHEGRDERHVSKQET